MATLIAHLQLDALTGGDTATDAVGDFDFLFVFDPPTVAAGEDGNAFTFVGDVDTPDHGFLFPLPSNPFAEGLSVHGWVKVTLPLAAEGTDQMRGLLSVADTDLQDADGTIGELFGLYVMEDGRIRVRWNSDNTPGGLQELTSTESIASGEWVHIRASRLPDGTAAIYFDGDEQASAALDPVEWTAGANTVATLGVGYAYGVDVWTGFTGAADDLKILTLDEGDIGDGSDDGDEGESEGGGDGGDAVAYDPLTDDDRARAYAQQLKLLLPRGLLWNLEPDSVLSAFLLAPGDEMVRVDRRAVDLVNEWDPRTADETIAEWEAAYDLTPGAGDTLAERRGRLLTAVLTRQRFRPVDFQNILAPILGMDAADLEISETPRAFAILVGDDGEIFKFYIYRDPLLPGSYDVDEAQAVVDRIKPSHTAGFVIESISLLCDTATDLCDRDRLGV